LELLEDRLAPAVYTVNALTDTGAGTGLTGDLRYCINASNANPNSGGPDVIQFNVGGGGVQTIAPTSPLPAITDPVIIDGSSQPGFSGSPLIELNGASAGSGANGLSITAGNSTVRGLVINNFGQNGILLSGGGTNLIAGNYVGTDVSGTLNRGNGLSGVLIQSSGNTVGGTGTWDGNVISGNKGTRNSLPVADGGISIASANNNVLEGNRVGTNAAGTGALGNSGWGIVVIGTSTGNSIGAAGTHNVVSANSRSGIAIALGATGNSVLGNYVGTDIWGNNAIGNVVNGILMQFDGDGNTIQGNVVSGNAIGINIIDAKNNVVQGNRVGTNAGGTAALGNTGNSAGFGPGIAIYAQAGYTATGNLIGGTTAAARNVISANKAGVWIQGAATTGNTVEGNYIGTDATGTATLGNSGPGVELVTVFAGATGANNNTIGGRTAGAGNLITGNGGAGILLTNFNSIVSTTGSGVTSNLLVGNSIYNNSGLGIDLGGDGITPNDPGDADTGPNNLQNFPVLTAAESGSSLLVSGTLNSAANTTYTIDVYASQAADPSGYGEGQYYLGTTTVTTDASGNVSFAAAFSAAALPGGVVPAGWFVSATATDPGNNTSEFSADVQAAASAPAFTQAITQSLQSTINTSSTPAVTLQATPDTAAAVAAAIAGVTVPQNTTASVFLNLAPGTYSATTVQVPAGMTLYINGTPGTVIDPASPAFTLTSGNVVVSNVTFVTTGDAPTILVTGGSLTLRNDTIQESSGGDDAAIVVTGGTVDLGNAASSGGNTLNVNGPGTFVRNTTGSAISAVGDTYTVNGQALTPASLSGFVFEDFNNDGQLDFGEKGIAGVTITLTGTDFLGNAVSLSQQTDGDGAYLFLNLLPGSYYLTETQPAGYLQGTDSVGTACGSLVAADQFSVSLAPEANGLNYNFGEQPTSSGSVQRGQTAGIGFWNNKNGQALIKGLNCGPASTQLANWLAATLPHMFGVLAGGSNLAGKSNADVAALFQADFLQKGVKLDAQVLATALSVYATNATLDSTGAAAAYGFTVSGDGVATAAVNVGSNGDAFGVANNTTMTVMDLLLATDVQAVNGVLYNGDATLRKHANNVYSALNDAGGN
jgi:parallel beta-helix repeat protein